MKAHIKDTNIAFLAINYKKDVYLQLLVLEIVLNDGWVKGINDDRKNAFLNSYVIVNNIKVYFYRYESAPEKY